MKNFMDKDFLLETETAKHLFHDYAEHMPIVDYHCHISPQEIFENRTFNNITEAWLGGQNADGSYAGDHYKWRVMRSHGLNENYITGNEAPEVKFKKFAEALEMAPGNPVFHWSNAELQKFFGFDGYLCGENADEVYQMTKEKLQNDESLTVRGMIKRSNVAMIGTTDDPIDSLEWHEKIAADDSITVKVLPSFRPDKAINIHKEGFHAYIKLLAKSVGKESLDTVEDICSALSSRLDFFKAHGCAASDHGLDYIPYRVCEKEEVEAIFQKALRNEVLSVEEVEAYQTTILLHVGREYHRHGMAMQLHYSCLRNVNEKRFRKFGPDTGFDMISQNTCGGNIAQFLSALDLNDQCPKTILYSLNPADNEQLGTILGCFQSDEIPGKIQHGSAWWFNDTKTGMQDQLISLANLGLLGHFVGMLTDSRSFLSYARHDYFRRILCNLLGQWVENGEYPNDERLLKKIVEGISYNNAAKYFGV